MTAPLPSPREHHIDYPNVTAGASLDHDRLFHADAVVVGTGAGGATAAARLRDGGLDVLMLEEGALHRTESFTTDPITMIRRLYRDAGTSMILGNPPIIFAEGRCVGGSTVINGGMTWRTPEPVLARWERELGLVGLGPRAIGAVLRSRRAHPARGAEPRGHLRPQHAALHEGRRASRLARGARATQHAPLRRTQQLRARLPHRREAGDARHRGAARAGG